MGEADCGEDAVRGFLRGLMAGIHVIIAGGYLLWLPFTTDPENK